MARRVGSQGERTEAAIRAAATRLMAQHGYEALSMRRLAEEVDLGAAALYRYFPTKQSILLSLLETHMDELLAAWAEARLGCDAAPAERLEVFTRFHVRHHLPRSYPVFLSYMELRSLTPENFSLIEMRRRTYERDLREILADGKAAGTMQVADPAVVARAIIAMLTGITTWYRTSGALAPDAIEEIYVGLVAGMCGLAGLPTRARFALEQSA